MLRALLSVFLVVYFAIWLSGGLGLRWPEAVCPESLLFFTRSACLFPHAAVDAIDYHAEGWDCSRRRWVELDFHPYFPLVISGRETRFERTVHLFRHNPQVMGDLRAFLITHFNPDHPQAPIADVRLLSSRLPLAPPGGTLARYQRPRLSEVPAAQRKLWSRPTAMTLRDERCQAAVLGQSFDPRDPRDPDDLRRPSSRPSRRAPGPEKNENGGES